MNVFYINRKKIYAALLLLILIYTILFYTLSLKVALTKNELEKENTYIN